MDENAEVEYEEYPEREPQAGPNRYDVARVLLLPLLSVTQGYAKMIDQFYGLLVLQSEVHDAKKAAEEMEKAFK
jgi:hypothetical protein